MSTRLIPLAALLYLGFVIYGSLVPLDFRPLPLDDAFERMRHIRYLNLGIGSLADWVANLLLFIPLTFLTLCSLHPRGAAVRVLLSLALLGAAVCLALAIEFTQLFFPPRTVSQNDILAETLGGGLGILAWHLFGERFMAFIRQLQTTHGAVNLAEKLLWVYLALLFGYNVLPLDLTLSPIELYHKWSGGRINLVPFGAHKGGPIEILYEITVDMAVWVPAAFLMVLSRRTSPHRALLVVIASAIALELFQLIVYSRFTDVTDILTAIPGAWIGNKLARRLSGMDLTSDPSSRGGRRVGARLAAVSAWTLLLLAAFWYPFELELDRATLKSRLDLLLQVPLVAYYYGSEFHAITQLLRKVSLFLIYGGLMAWLRLGLLPRFRLSWWDGLAFATLGLVAFTIELGQVALVAKSPDSTDMVIEWLSGGAGYRLLLVLYRRWAPSKPVQRRGAAPSAAEPRSE